MDNVKFGLLSLAHYHGNFWAMAVNQSPDAQLVGIWDDDAARGQAGAEKYHTRYFSDLHALLHEVDAVGITSETTRHAPLVEEAAAAGCHIICEKPMATTLADCDRIAHAVKKAGVTYLQNFPKRFDPINHELVGMVQRGELGKIAMVRVRHANYHFIEQAPSGAWFLDPQAAGAGALLDEGIHGADFLLWLLGEPKTVTALTSDRTLGLPMDDTACAVFRYPSGTLAELTTAETFFASEQSIEVYGTEGSAILSGVDLASKEFSQGPYLRYYRRGEPRGIWRFSATIPLFKLGNFHQQGPLHLIECLRTGKGPILGVDGGRKSLEMILAAYRAAETGRTVDIEFTRSTE